MALTGKLKEAYDRAVTEGRFENVEARDGKEARARAELRLEQSQQSDNEQGGGNGGGSVSSDLNDAYQRAVKGERFEGSEARDGKDARARKQLEWEKTAAGKKWLQEQGLSGGGQGDGGQGANIPPPTMEFKKSDAYRSLSQEQKDLIDISFGTIATGGQREAQQLAQAIKQAQGVADPFFKSQLALTRAGIIQNIVKNTQDFRFGEQAIKRVRDELLEDVAIKGEQLSLEEQAQVRQTVRKMEDDILDLRDQAALKGTTMGRGRFSLQEDLREEEEDVRDVLQSIRRRGNFERRRLELRAERGEQTAQEDLEKLRFSRGLDLRNIAREAESLIGTEAARGIGEQRQEFQNQDLFVGDVMGDIEEQRRRSIISDTSAFLDLQQGFNLSASL